MKRGHGLGSPHIAPTRSGRSARLTKVVIEGTVAAIPAPRERRVWFGGPVGEVELVAVDEVVLAALVRAATTDAAADEVTPPLTADGSWTPGRVAWLQAFHRDRRDGLDGPLGQATWAVVADGHVVGSVRLASTEDRKSTRLNSSHANISYAVFCLKK